MKKKSYGNKLDLTVGWPKSEKFPRCNENMLLMLAGGDPPQNPNSADPF